MSIRSRREERIAQKAADVTRAGLMDALGMGGGFSATPDGTVPFFQHFGQSYSKMYRSQSALRSVIDFLSRNIGAIHMKLSQDVDGVRTPRPDHVAQQILEHPQPGVSYSRMMRAIVADKAIYDVAAVWKIRENFNPASKTANGFIRNSGRVVNLVRIPIPYISVSQGSLTGPLVFEMNAGDQIKIPAADVIWMPGYAPDSNVTGVPPVETLRQILAEEWAAGKDRENQWKKGAQGNVVFVQDVNMPGLDEAAAANFKVGWNNKYGGVNASNAREIPLLPAGIKPEAISLNGKELEYLATRRLAREEVCRQYGIQPSLLGVTQANFASADLWHQMLYQDTLSPWCVSIQEDFEEQYLPEFEDVSNGFFIDFNINAKLSGSFLEQAQIGQQAVGGPWMTMNEFREKFMSLPPLPGGDDIMVPLNTVRGGGSQANPQDAKNQFNSEDIEGVLKLAARRE